MHTTIVRRNRQGGAFIVTVCLMLFFLLGFIGIALDFGRLFIVKTELQTATDACALAAAQELDRQPDALVRATNAGLAAGNANGVVMQSALWNGKGQLTADNLSFRDASHTLTVSPADAHYVRCEHTQTATATPLLRMLAVFGNAQATNAAADVFARAEATLAPSQSTCPLPLALKPKLGGAKPDYGFVKGEWITLLSKDAASNGQIGWANLDGSNNAAETEAEMKGYCGTRVDDELGTPGVQQSIADVWNARFGIYKGTDTPQASQPDFTGYVFNAKTWPAQKQAFDHDDAVSNDFMEQRARFGNCGATVKDCETATGLKLNAKTMANAAELRQYGGNRRIAPVPVVNAANKVVDFACMLMLQPISTPMADVQLEYLGNASEPGSPCIASGLPGGSAGPLVPVLVL